jgi:hypothetical protein
MSAVGVQLLLVPTTSEICVVALKLPDTPLTVTLYVPAAAEALAEKVSPLEVVVGLVPNEAVTPEGNPEADSVTLPVKPPEGVTEIVSLPVPPCATFTVDADELNVKLGPLPTVMTKFCVLVQDVELT